MRALVTPHPHHSWSHLFNFTDSNVYVGVSHSGFDISLLTDDVLFLCLFASHVSCLVKCLFKSACLKKNESSVFLWSCRNS